MRRNTSKPPSKISWTKGDYWTATSPTPRPQLDVKRIGSERGPHEPRAWNKTRQQARKGDMNCQKDHHVTRAQAPGIPSPYRDRRNGSVAFSRGRKLGGASGVEPADGPEPNNISLSELRIKKSKSLFSFEASFET